MRKYLLALAVALLIALPASAYVVKRGDTPYGLWGNNWKTELKEQVGISDPTKLPVGIEVNTQDEKFGFIPNPSVSGGSTPVSIKDKVTVFDVPETDNLLDNGSFDEDPFDTSWTTFTLTDATLTATTTATSSPQAAICTMTGDDSDGCILTQTVTHQASGLDFNMIIDAKGGVDSHTGTTTLRFMILDNTPVYQSEGDYWDGFSECQYVDGGNWTKTAVTSTKDDAIDSCEMNLVVGATDGVPLTTTTYSNYNLYGLTGSFPTTFDSEKTALWLEMFGDTGDEVLIDNVEITTQAYTAYSDISTSLFDYKASSSTLREYSKFCLLNATDGCLWWYSYDFADNELKFYTSASSAPTMVTSSTY